MFQSKCCFRLTLRAHLLSYIHLHTCTHLHTHTHTQGPPEANLMLAFENKGGWRDVKGAVVMTVLNQLMGGGSSFSSGVCVCVCVRGGGECF